MSVSFEIDALEKEVQLNNIDVLDKVSNIRTLLLSEDININHFSSKEVKTFAIRIWNTTVKLQKMISTSSESNKSALKLSIIPQMRIATVEIYKKFLDKSNEDDIAKLFYFISYTYKSLIDSNNGKLANQYFETAIQIYSRLKPSSSAALTFVHLKIWQVQHEISEFGNYDNALLILKDFTENNSIESSNLVSFVYEKAVECKSIDWCQYCSSFAHSTSGISNEMTNQIDSFLAQLYLINSKPEDAGQILSNLPKTINTIFLELKCSILLSPKDPTLKGKLISFISLTQKDFRYLVAICIFIADNFEKIDQIAIEFIHEALKYSQIIKNFEIRKHIYLSAIRISCSKNDLNASNLFLKIIKDAEDQNKNQMFDEDRRKISGIFWNKAVDIFYSGEYELAIQWMQMSRSQLSEIANKEQSSCLLFISRCYYELSKYTEALSYSNETIEKCPSCWQAHLLKFEMLCLIDKEKDAFDHIEKLLKTCPFLEDFEPSFFTSVACELHSKGNDLLSLETLLRFYKLNFNLGALKKSDEFNFISSETDDELNTLKTQTVNSIFALLQTCENVEIVFEAINTISSLWCNQVINQQTPPFSPDEIQTYVAIAFNNGLELKKIGKIEKAIQTFLNGSVIGGSIIECKTSCLFEFIDSSICSKSKPNLLGLIEKLGNEIESASSIDQKYLDGFSLCKLKVMLTEMSEDNNFFNECIEIIDDVTSPSVLCEICDFVVEKKSSREIIKHLLKRAGDLDKLNMSNPSNDKMVASVSVSLLSQLVMHSENINNARNAFDLVNDFLVPENASLMSTSHMQFFMSHAWNIGVHCVKSMKVPDSIWWFQTALKIMNMNEELKSLYSIELSEKYAKLIDAQ